MNAISQTAFSNAFSWIKMFLFRVKISLKFVPKCPINNIPTMALIMAWRRPGDKPLSEPMMVSLLSIYASLGLNDLKRLTEWPWTMPWTITVQYRCYRPTDHNDVIMSAMSSQITSFMIVSSAVYSGADQRKHQSSVSLAFVRGIRRWPINSPHKGPVTRKLFPFDDVIMERCKQHNTPRVTT